MKNFSLIVAVDSKNGIGKNNDLAWHIPKDLKYFKEITTTTVDHRKQNAVIMGRKTWESIPEKYRPLPNRYNAVLSRSYDNHGGYKQGAYTYQTLSGALEDLSYNESIEKFFITGGAQIYNSVLNNPNLETIYLTKIYKNYDCDSFLNSIPKDFVITSQSQMYDHKGVKYEFLIYERNNSMLI